MILVSSLLGSPIFRNYRINLNLDYRIRNLKCSRHTAVPPVALELCHSARCFLGVLFAADPGRRGDAVSLDD